MRQYLPITYDSRSSLQGRIAYGSRSGYQLRRQQADLPGLFRPHIVAKAACQIDVPYIAVYSACPLYQYLNACPDSALGHLYFPYILLTERNALPILR